MLYTEFNKLNFYDYPAVTDLIKDGKYILVESQEELQELNSVDLLFYIQKAQIEEKVLIFNNILFNDIYINNLEIDVPIIFSHCKFKENIKITNNSFLYNIVFYFVEFLGNCKFKLSKFFNGVSYINCNFHEEVSFERVKFISNQVKYLKKDTFDLEIKFIELFYLSNLVNFLGVTFSNKVNFNSAYFGCTVIFSYFKNKSTVFRGNNDFSCTPGESEQYKITKHDDPQEYIEVELELNQFQRLSFIGVKFYAEVTFENRIFQKKTLFSDNMFYTAPKFHNCVLHQDTDFIGSSFKDTYSEGAEHAYRTLKFAMDEKRARREESMFFALEQRSILNTPLRRYNFILIDFIRIIIDRIIIWSISSKRDLELYENRLPKYVFKHPGFCVYLTEKIISFLYLLASDYGQSIKRPVVILITQIFIIFPLIYKSCFAKYLVISDRWSLAYHMSFQQLFRPFEVYTVKFYEQYHDTPLSLYTLATIQSLLNITLVTLFLLAIRGRFRMY